MLEELPPCSCRLHQSAGDEADWDDGDRKLVTDVQRHGWHVVGVHSHPGRSPWAFTVGLWHTFRSPEVSMFGLELEDMFGWLNRAGEQVRDGRVPQPDERREGILDGFPIQWRPAHDSWYQDLFGYGLWFYRGWFPMLQIAWPDRNGVFAWEERCGERCRRDQPITWKPAEEQPLGRWRHGPQGMTWLWPDLPDRTVFLTRRIAHEHTPVTAVFHERDGDWQFLDGGQRVASDVALAHLGDIVSRFPDVNELADLPLGWRAWRSTPTDPWQREPSSIG